MLGNRARKRAATAAPPIAGHGSARASDPEDEASPPQPWDCLGCERDPFATAPDPEFFFATPAAQKLYMSLLTVLRIGDGGLLLVTGEAGVGKTLLLHVLRKTLQAGGEQVRLPDGADASWLDRIDGVADGPPTREILLTDGAEAWDPRTVARLERLYEQHGAQASALRLVIAGRPEIEQRLQRLIATAAGTKITFARLRLDALERSSIADLIEHRLRAAGAVTQGPFTPAAIYTLSERAQGNPGRAIAACRAELLAQTPVPPSIPPAAPSPPRRRWLPFAATAALLAVAAGTAALYVLPLPPTTPQVVTAPVAAAPAAPIVIAAPSVQPAPPAPKQAAVPPVYAESLAAISPAAGPPEPRRSAFDAAFAFLRQSVAPAPLPARAPEVPAIPGVQAVVASEPAPTLLPQVAPETGPKPEPEPTPGPGEAPDRLRLTDAEVAALTERGDAYLRLGDLASARPFYERAAAAGDANAALLLGQTYDPGLLARIGLGAARGDAAKAADWYRQAQMLGAAEAERLLANLTARR